MKTRDVVISAVALFLAYAAFDDITTDQDTNFVFEWTIVAAAGLWFAWLAWRRTRRT